MFQFIIVSDRRGTPPVHAIKVYVALEVQLHYSLTAPLEASDPSHPHLPGRETVLASE
jgi:hypothetical protein